MEGAEKGAGSDKEPPPLRIDPKCLQDALKSFFQPIKTDDPRLDFYTRYKKEATEHDTDYVKKYDEDLNTTLIFAGLFSAVSAAFVIDVHSNLRPDPNEQSTALLRAILLTLNQSAIPGGTPTVPPVPEHPPSEIVTATGLMYASLLISLLAAFVAMLGKQWLNRYLRNSGGSMIERCGDRQRKRDGLEKWPLHLFVESLSVMLQVALLLLACGLCRHMWSINASIAYILITLTGLGVVFYVAVVFAGMSSYACPLQTPASTALRGPWKKVRRAIAFSIVHSKRALLWSYQVWDMRVELLLHRQPLPPLQFETVRVRQSEPWLMPKELDTIRRTNANDVRCVSWILRNITEPEALDAAVRLAGEIRWFDDGINVDIPYGLIVSTFEACFDPTGRLYPGSRDRAYYSGRAMMWIRTLATCKSEEFARAFPLQTKEYTTPAPDRDLADILLFNGAWSIDFPFTLLLDIHPESTPLHSQWISNVLLHLSSANPSELGLGFIPDPISHAREPVVPLNATLNRLLVWCISLGSPVEEEVLKVTDKSGCVERILRQLSKAVISATNGTNAQRKFIPQILRDLIMLETRPWCLTEMAYGWCSMIYENRQSYEDWESLLLTSLEIGFRHLDFEPWSIKASLTHTEHHQELVDTVFKSQESEVIADLLHAWTAQNDSQEPPCELLGLCSGRLVGLQNLVPFSSRLRRLVIRSIGLIGYKGFEGEGVKGLVELLNHLYVTVDEMDDLLKWGTLLLEILRTPEGVQDLSYWYWESLVEISMPLSRSLRRELVYSPQTTTFLSEAQEWSKLECWMGTVWMVWPPGARGTTEEDLEYSMELLFRQRPRAIQQLEQWMERWRREYSWNNVPEAFQRLCREAHETA